MLENDNDDYKEIRKNRNKFGQKKKFRNRKTFVLLVSELCCKIDTKSKNSVFDDYIGT